MGTKMNRGKRSVMFEYLPGQTYDFDRTGVIARSAQVRATPNTDLNLHLVIAAVEAKVRYWKPEHRRLFPDNLTQRANSFVLLEPRGVSAEMYPLMFGCDNKQCSRVYDFSKKSLLPSNCPVCKIGRLHQVRFVRIHRCGAMLPLRLYCATCRSGANMALNTRGSERISGFQWICRQCNTTAAVFGGICDQCTWDKTDIIPKVPNPQIMDVVNIRAGGSFYPHSVTLLNQPGRTLSAFLEINNWQAIAAAAHFEFPEVFDKPLLGFVRYKSPAQATMSNLDASQIDALKAKGFSDADVARFMEMQAQLGTQATSASEPDRIAGLLVERTGVANHIWNEAGREMLEAVLPMQSGGVEQLFGSTDPQLDRSQPVAEQIGLERVTLVSDFPITTATFGFSRAAYKPAHCFINPFPPDPDHNNKFPIFVDMIQADAIIVRLEAARMCKWLQANNQPVVLPIGSGSEALRQRAYFVELFNGLSLRETIDSTNPQARMAFGLLHSLSHLCVRRAALLCGLDRESLSEYVLPGTLSFAIYSSHRFGATIGALTALFQQTLFEWLTQIRDSKRCVYDPVCGDQGGKCHACMHLSEMSCQYFNLNLGRSFLYGGRDVELGDITGYFNFIYRSSQP